MVIIEEEGSSSGGSGYYYDVFLSFRGEDTRFTFTDHLYNALVHAQVHTFRDDDEIEDGENLKPALEKAIKESRAFIIVLSENYASSTWCLDELLLILERKRASNHFVLPVFYHVNPSDVRKQKGSFAEAFRTHEEKQVGTENQDEWQKRLKAWRDALTEVANLKSTVIHKNQADGRYESQLINNIVRAIYSKLDRKVLSNPKHLVGMQSRVKDINSWVRDNGASNVLAIIGMGGIGKTTMSKHIYNSNFRDFDCSTFLADIRNVSEQPNGLLGLQKQLLDTILSGRMPKIDNVDDATDKIENALGCKRVLLVLDDVEEDKQIDALLGTKLEFHPGSKIIITTTNKSLKIVNGACRKHTLKELNDHESLQLLCWHAFGLNHPKEGYEKLSKQVASKCGGIPLALEVLGSSLLGKNIEIWESMFKLLKKENNPKIQKILRISYDSLQYDNDKEVFLHIACFFVGKDRDFVVKILDSPDSFPTSAIQNLVDRCLLDIRSNRLEMHRLIQEMGREIVRKESPKNPGERSRLWCHEDSFNVLKEEKATEKIEGLMLDMEMLKEKNLPNQVISHNKSHRSVDVTPSKEELKTDAFTRMDKLALLKLNYARLNGTYKDFPQKLRWLCWHGFPLKSIPLELPMENLVVLDMSYSKLEHVWTTEKRLESLKILDLSYSVALVRTPDFSGLTNLETLRLTGCASLVEICETIGNLGKLVVLDLAGCVNLKELPRSISMLKSLKILDLSYSVALVRTPDFSGLTNLETLKLRECTSLVEICDSFGKLGKLVLLDLAGCVNLKELPRSISTLKSLKELHADRIGINSAELKSRPQLSLASLPHSLVQLSLTHNNLFTDSFPSDLSSLSSLNYLNLEGNPFETLPTCFKSLPSLKRLHMMKCRRLKRISGLPTAIKYLDVDGCNSLETLKLYSPQSPPPNVSNTDFRILLEMQGVFKLQPLESFDENKLNYLGLGLFKLGSNLNIEQIKPVQVLYEFGIFSTFIHGSEVPEGFNCREDKTPISFVVTNKIRGLNVASVYYPRTCLDQIWIPFPMFTKVTNTTKGLVWIYNPIVYIKPVVSPCIWLSHWTFGDQLKVGDEVTVSIVMDEHLEVTKFGISVSYYDTRDDEVGQNGAMEEYRWKQVISGDLSKFEISTGTYFLCRHGFIPLRDLTNHKYKYIPEGDWTDTKWFRELAGGSINYEDVKDWQSRCPLKWQPIRYENRSASPFMDHSVYQRTNKKVVFNQLAIPLKE